MLLATYPLNESNKLNLKSFSALVKLKLVKNKCSVG